jgi:hypothetical protein
MSNDAESPTSIAGTLYNSSPEWSLARPSTALSRRFHLDHIRLVILTLVPEQDHHQCNLGVEKERLNGNVQKSVENPNRFPPCTRP